MSAEQTLKLKEQIKSIAVSCNAMANSRALSLVRTKLEEACMWCDYDFREKVAVEKRQAEGAQATPPAQPMTQPTAPKVSAPPTAADQLASMPAVEHAQSMMGAENL